MTENNYKDHIILILDSGEFKAHLITAKELQEHATIEMGEDDADESDALNDFVESQLETNAGIGWTELELNEKSILKLLDNVAELRTMLTQIKVKQ